MQHRSPRRLGVQTGRNQLIEQQESIVRLGLDDLLAPIVAIGADVVTQVHFARGGLDGNRRVFQVIVRTMHAALGRRLLVLLNGHVNSLQPMWRAIQDYNESGKV